MSIWNYLPINNHHNSKATILGRKIAIHLENKTDFVERTKSKKAII